ncbi:MAG: NAD(+) synthase [Muribaculaceae bacterium]|nr:NAD(+) synthase [Muribaculaceae bacterium]
MRQGFLRAVAAVPAVSPADCESNTRAIIEMLKEPELSAADVIVFPEMCVTGYTCGDLFHNFTLLSGACKAVSEIASATGTDGPLIFIGAPVQTPEGLYNCAIAIRGRVLAIIPKTYIPNYNEFYEQRWWRSEKPAVRLCETPWGTVPFGSMQLIKYGDALVGAEVCEDLWTPIPPSSVLSMHGAEVMVNLSASDDLIGKYHYLQQLIEQQSARCLCAYVYSSAGYGESSTDLVFDGKAVISDCGKTLAVNERWVRTPQFVSADVDLMAIRRDRLHHGSFQACGELHPAPNIIITDAGAPNPASVTLTLKREVSAHPFVPSGKEHLRERCREILNIQTASLARRLQFTGCQNLVVGISGGLDSTLALLVAVEAFDSLGIQRTGITGVTMPGFGTTGRTYNNALMLMKELGVSVREISIVPAVKQHFSDIGHNPEVHDVTYENSQARERTQLLMDIANELSGMVLGTGDLSELALGWATYNGDHMSMYGVNSGVPKTLVRYLTHFWAQETESEATRAVLLDILDTPVSPELLPAQSDGTIAQRTEDLVGPYELHDFFLYYMLRYGFTPTRVYYLAVNAFADKYSRDVILHWMRTFYRRFFSQQFKRSCLPDGPKVGSVCLSPRGDWRMPSDASAALWLAEVDKLKG